MAQAPQSEFVQFDLEGGIAWLRFNRPEKMNAISPQMREDLVAILDHVRGNPEIRALVLTGNGRAFCSGADLATPGGFHVPENTARAMGLDGSYGADHRNENHRWSWWRLPEMLWAIEKPVIAAVNGWAMGMGGSFMLFADVVIASTEARFRLPWAFRGLPLEAGQSYILTRILGIKKAKTLALFGDYVSGEQLAALGLADVCVPADQLEAVTREWAEKAAALPTRNVGILKRQLQMGLDSTLERSFYDEIMWLGYTGQTEDATESRTAFREKREAVYTGR